MSEKSGKQVKYGELFPTSICELEFRNGFHVPEIQTHLYIGKFEVGLLISTEGGDECVTIILRLTFRSG